MNNFADMFGFTSSTEEDTISAILRLLDERNRLNNDGRPPIVPFYLGATDYRVPLGYTAEQVMDTIRTTLSDIEGIVFTKNGWCFEVEYGTKPIAYTKWREVGHKFMENREISAIEAAAKAIQMFPHNATPFNEEDYNDEVGWVCRYGWSLFDFEVNRISATEPGHAEELIVSLKKRSDDSRIVWPVFRHIQSELTEANMLWLNRKEFLSWIHGTEEQVSREDEPIKRYLFDHYVGREICTFMPCT